MTPLVAHRPRADRAFERLYRRHGPARNLVRQLPVQLPARPRVPRPPAPPVTVPVQLPSVGP